MDGACVLCSEKNDSGPTRSGQCALAALAKGMATHTMELDDAYLPGPIHNADGRTLSASARHAKGGSAHALPENEVIAKHRSIFAGIVDDQTDEVILDVILQLEAKPDFAKLTRFLSEFRAALADPAISGPRLESALPKCAFAGPELLRRLTTRGSLAPRRPRRSGTR